MARYLEEKARLAEERQKIEAERVQVEKVRTKVRTTNDVDEEDETKEVLLIQ